MRKINWESGWKVLFTITLAAVMNIVTDVFRNLDNPIFVVLAWSGLLLTSFAVVQMAWTGIEKGITTYKRRRDNPRIEHEFRLPKENDLRLRIHNPHRPKPIHIKCVNTDLFTRRRKKYIHEYPDDLKPVRDSRSSRSYVYNGTLTPNDTVEIQLSDSYEGKVALRLYNDDSPTYNFRDGRWEYVVSCQKQYLGKDFISTKFSIWLIIKNGVLVEISKQP